MNPLFVYLFLRSRSVPKSSSGSLRTFKTSTGNLVAPLGVGFAVTRFVAAFFEFFTAGFVVTLVAA